MPKITVKGTKNLSEELDEKMRAIEDERLEEIAKTTAGAANLQYVNLRAFPVDSSALFLIEESKAKNANLAAIERRKGSVTVAVLDPANTAIKETLVPLTQQGITITLVVVSPHSLQIAWDRYRLQKKASSATQGIVVVDVGEIATLKEQIQDISDLKERIVRMPITQVLGTLLAGALKIGASDIHFEPEEKEIRLRYRLDGALSDVVSFSRNGYSDLISRIKLSAGLKINVHNTPQDGRFTIRLEGKDIEVRISVLPGAYGENAVMRILDPSTIRQKLEDLGMRPDTLELAKKLLQKTTGTILTTGPTGSGKTTTLYAFVQHINAPDIKIITIEDPIEYHIQGISQTQVNEHARYSFADGLRSIVRQDPDVILVGEIRDQETAEVAMQAALTGHLVLSTIHTNDAAGTIPRLIALGVNPVTIAPAVHAAMAQRLVRRLCVVCRKRIPLTGEAQALIEKEISTLYDLKKTKDIYTNVGCSECNGTGYKGRIGVYEIFEVDDEMQKLILKSPAVAEIQELAVKKGLTTMLQDALIKVVQGTTSFEEVMRVIGE